MASSSSSKYRDQGVYVDSSQSEFLDDRRVGNERAEVERGGRDVDDFSKETHGRYEGSQAHASSSSSAAATSNSKSGTGTLMSPYGDYDMDESSFFAHTTRLNIVGPNRDFTQYPKRRSLSTERLLIKHGEKSLETAYHKTTRSRSSSPVIPEKRTSPTESYLQQSLQPSLPLENPTASRKLLVLDLNGTLLLRSNQKGRRGAPPLPYSRIYDDSSTVPRTSPRFNTFPALRTVYPRPYLPSFCAYIFHPTNLQWLDTMVWSSAQPHSVNDMVDKCFGSYKEGLKAIWARDTLGLSYNQYREYCIIYMLLFPVDDSFLVTLLDTKTQTTKDLAKPWAHIPSLIPDPENLDSEVDAADKDDHPQQQHSALTTILMDDSPLKAVLQPWNHLCVSEYEQERRKLDVELVERELERLWVAERDHANEEGKRKKKEKKKLLKKEKLLLAREQQQLEEGVEEVEGEEGEGEESYDEFMLAVIGILDVLKHEGNVAGWMRSGGLVRLIGDERDTIPESIQETEETTTTTISSITSGSKRDSSTISIQEGPSKRRRLSHTQDIELESDSEMVRTTPTRKNNNKRISMSPVFSSSPPSPPSSSPLLSSARVEQALTGVPLSTDAAAASSTKTSGDNVNSIPTQTQTQHQQPLLWYETPYVLSFWAQRGREALAELGIDVIHGVVSPNLNGSGWGNSQYTGGGGL